MCTCENFIDDLLFYFPKEKLNTVLTVLKHSPVPWSATITRICDDSLRHDNSTSRLILEQKRMINCKLILKKYDFKEITLIQQHVSTSIRKIKNDPVRKKGKRFL